MTFPWLTPPWQRDVDCTYMAVTLTDAGDQISMAASAVRGDTETEALADLLMGPGSAAIAAAVLHDLIGVVVRDGVDELWLTRPPIHVEAVEARDTAGVWVVTVDAPPTEEATWFSATDTRRLLAQLQDRYGA
ncbi:hypothetical protein [Streptomyces sp. NRRL F-525]|uniref:hypothetical protein n=1 Tax=Streptomyces sp. NRRL F-525 TaxID=1463861 RepID=UPI000524DE2A|nr:hypothetical protein [Streptomyces sp. NRRL F-525]